MISSEEIEKYPRKKWANSSEVSFDSSEVSFDSSEVSFDSSEVFLFSSEEVVSEVSEWIGVIGGVRGIGVIGGDRKDRSGSEQS